MELIFLENDGKWIAEFKVDKEFNLHIEREDGTGKIKMYQNSATGGKYAIVEDFAINNNYKPVLDFSSGYFVGEKTIKIVSDVEPTYAAITTEGDVVEIKSQVKSIEITSNGTTSVEPDAGFSYLSKIDVKTNVPQSGEGGGSGGSIYIKAPSEYAGMLATICYLMKVKIGSDTYIVTDAMRALLGEVTEYEAFSFTSNDKTYANGIWSIIGEKIQTFPFELEYITEEEFYNLES